MFRTRFPERYGRLCVSRSTRSCFTPGLVLCTNQFVDRQVNQIAAALRIYKHLVGVGVHLFDRLDIEPVPRYARRFLILHEQRRKSRRIAVGVGAAALACRGYRHALGYARERTQGRASAARKDSAPVPIVVHADVRRMLLAQKVYAEGALALVLYCARLVDEEAAASSEAERDIAGQLLGLLTPIGKSWPAEFGLAANDLAIQVHGGYGYTRDFDVEQVYRDNRLNPIHEGTHGIQANDLVGRKILRGNGEALALLGERIDATLAACGDDLAAECAALRTAWADVNDTIAVLRTVSSEAALYNAAAFLSAFGHVVVAWLWLDQARAATADAVVRAGRRHACRYFFATELPKTRLQFALVRSGNDMAAMFPDACF